VLSPGISVRKEAENKARGRESSTRGTHVYAPVCVPCAVDMCKCILMIGHVIAHVL
jgi:hypothetical protein